MTFSEGLIQQVWEQKGRAVSEQDPHLWRKDECGAWVRRDHYGNRTSEFGWEIDYIIPGKSKELSNLRVLQWENYLAGGVGQVVCKMTADRGGIKNKPV